MARYRHPKHGFYVASYGDDLAALKAAGWVLDEPVIAAPESAPAPPAPPPEPDVVAAQVPAPPLASPYSRREPWRKRGR
jgi:hypothetical protein